MSRCLYLEYGSACDCGPCREGNKKRRQSLRTLDNLRINEIADLKRQLDHERTLRNSAEEALALAEAQRDAAVRERDSRGFVIARLEAHLHDLGAAPCPHRTERALVGPHGIGCECRESEADRWGKPLEPLPVHHEVSALRARVRLADGLVAELVASDYPLDCASFASLQAYRASAPSPPFCPQA